MNTTLRIVLILSLALNVFVGSAAISSWWRHGHVCLGPQVAQHRWRSSRLPGPGELRRILPQSDQKVLNEVLSAHRPQIRERYRALKQTRKSVIEALRAEPFDQTRLETAFAGVRENENLLATTAQAMLTDLAGRISPEGRARLAQQLQSRGGPDKNPRGGPGNKESGWNRAPDGAPDVAPPDGGDGPREP